MTRRELDYITLEHRGYRFGVLGITPERERTKC
jgi:hypothetical protein